MIKTLTYTAVLVSCILIACQPKNDSIDISIPSTQEQIKGTADTKSIALAEKVMAANGGQAAWDATRYIQWNFFGSRKHIWDKKTNNLIIEGIKDEYLIKMNLDNDAGSVRYNGIQQTEADSLSKYIKKGKQMWNNDAYWLLMPYKLRDPGVHLKYLGLDSIEDRTDIHKIEMTYTNVGDTPDNKYHIYIHPDTDRIVQWEFFPKASDKKSRFITPWTEYKKYGNIMLAGSRGENYEISDIQVDTPELLKAFKN